MPYDEIDDKIKIGDKVRHHVFGVGEVISVRPDGAIAKIKFVGSKYERDIRLDVVQPKMEIKREAPKTRIRWWNRGRLSENVEWKSYPPFTVGDEVKHKEHTEFGKGIVREIVGDHVYIEFEKNTGNTHDSCKPGHAWSTSPQNNYMYEFIGGNRYRKIMRPDVDPYGEEHWGYEKIVQESEATGKFEVGDIVTHKNHKKFGQGVVVYINGQRDTVIINFEKETGHSYEYSERNHGWNTSQDATYMYDFLDRGKRIERPDIDPYGEEHWGWEEEVKENKIIKSFKKYIEK